MPASLFGIELQLSQCVCSLNNYVNSLRLQYRDAMNLIKHNWKQDQNKYVAISSCDD